MAPVKKNESVRQLFQGYARGQNVVPIRLQCNWSKMLRFAPGMKIPPDQLFQVNFHAYMRTYMTDWGVSLICKGSVCVSSMIILLMVGNCIMNMQLRSQSSLEVNDAL